MHPDNSMEVSDSEQDLPSPQGISRRGSIFGKLERFNPFSPQRNARDDKLDENEEPNAFRQRLSIFRRRTRESTQKSKSKQQNSSTAEERRKERDFALKDVLGYGNKCLEEKIEATAETISSIIKTMKKYRHDVEVQQGCAKTLSNIAMASNNCTTIFKGNGIKYLKRAMNDHTNDWRLQWLTCSALWNIARPADTRREIGTEGIKLIFAALENFQEKPLVQETALGALANLSISDHYKIKIGSSDRISLIYEAMQHHQGNARVQTSACSLLTNLAFKESISTHVGKTGGIELIVQAMKTHANTGHLQRNACASLSNLSTSDENFYPMLESRVVESLYLATSQDFGDYGVSHLAANALENMNCDSKEVTTSLHLISKFPKCRATSLRTLLLNPENDINALDHAQLTPLQAALRQGHQTAAFYLAACGGGFPKGCDIDAEFEKLSQHHSAMKIEVLKSAVTEGRFRFHSTQDSVVSALLELEEYRLFKDICRLLYSFLHPAELILNYI